MKRILILACILPFLFASCTKKGHKVLVYLDTSNMSDVVLRSNFGVHLDNYSDEEVSNHYLKKFYLFTTSDRMEYTDDRGKADLILDAKSLRVEETVRFEYRDSTSYDLSTVNVRFSYTITEIGEAGGTVNLAAATQSDKFVEDENEDGNVEYDICRTSYNNTALESLTEVKKGVERKVMMMQ